MESPSRGLVLVLRVSKDGQLADAVVRQLTTGGARWPVDLNCMALPRGLELHQQLPGRHLVARLDRQARDGAVLPAAISCCIFMASTTTRRCPLATASPSLTSTATILPFIGARSSVSALPAAPAPARGSYSVSRTTRSSAPHLRCSRVAGKRVGSAALLPVDR